MLRVGIAFGAAVLFAGGAAQGVEHGPFAALGADGGWMWWHARHDHELSEPGQATTLDLESSRGAPHYGGRLALGWKLRPHPTIAPVPRLGLAYSQSRPAESRLDGELSSYRFEADATWWSLDAGADLHLFGQWATVGLGFGYGWLQSTESVSGFATGRDEMSAKGWVLHWSLGLRVPPQSVIAGRLGLAIETMGLSPFSAFWESRWVRASRVFLAASVEFDGSWLRHAEAP